MYIWQCIDSTENAFFEWYCGVEKISLLNKNVSYYYQVYTQYILYALFNNYQLQSVTTIINIEQSFLALNLTPSIISIYHINITMFEHTDMNQLF